MSYQSRNFHTMLAILLVVLASVSVSAQDKESKPIRFEVKQQGGMLHFVLENVSERSIEVYNNFNEAYGPAPYNWPENCFLQIRDSEGRMLTVDGDGYDSSWTPWFYVGQLTSIPAPMQTIKAGKAWEAKADLHGCLGMFRKTLQDPTVEIGAVKIRFTAKLDPMFTKSVVFTTDWLKVEKQTSGP